MAKKAKAAKKVKVKKVRTEAEKLARKLRRKQRRENVKAMASIKENVNAAIAPATQPLKPMFAKVETSDGLPFSKSVDNPYSILAQLKAMEELAAKTEAENKVKQLNDFRKVDYAGWTGRAKPNVMAFA